MGQNSLPIAFRSILQPFCRSTVCLRCICFRLRVARRTRSHCESRALTLTTERNLFRFQSRFTVNFCLRKRDGGRLASLYTSRAPMNASAYLQAQGWRGSGFSLDRSNRGLSKPLLVSQKTDQTGLGTKRHDFKDQWWTSAFDKSLKSLGTGASTVCKVEAGEGVDTTDSTSLRPPSISTQALLSNIPTQP